MTRPGIPAIFTQPPAIQDPLATETTDLQNQTREKCLPFLTGTHPSQRDHNEHGVPALKRDLHIGYLYDSLEDYPAGFVAMDASRPWMVYWGLAGFAMLGEDTGRFRDR
jgi:protein farnesyltransferase subunit beta